MERALTARRKPYGGTARRMKHIQVIDGADNCVYDIFAARAEDPGAGNPWNPVL